MSTDQDATIIELHHLVFAYCENHFGKALNRDLHETPKRFRLKFFRKLQKGREPRIIDRADLLTYLEKVSGELAGMLAKRSPYFWLFLYRRIKPVLSPGHDNLTDGTTTRLVRQILELAIYKFGSLGQYEFAKRSETDLAKQWGSYLKLAIDGMGRNREAATAMLSSTDSPDSLIPVDFRPADYRSIYAAEGLAYEYWLCTARLRSIGKGKRLWFDPSSGEFEYEAPEEISEAIERFNSRLTGVTFFPTLVGIVTPNNTEKPLEQIFATSYNTEETDLTGLFSALGFPAKSRDGGNLSNFVPALLSVEEFQTKHSYLDVTFQAARGFGLDVFLYILWAVSNLALVPNSSFNPDVNYGLVLFMLLRRGYTVYQTASFADAVKERLLLREDMAQEKLHEIHRAIDAVLSHISLSEESRKRITPWSGGPRPIVSRHKDSWLIDTVGIFEFMARMFVGIHDDGTSGGSYLKTPLDRLCKRSRRRQA